MTRTIIRCKSFGSKFPRRGDLTLPPAGRRIRTRPAGAGSLCSGLSIVSWGKGSPRDRAAPPIFPPSREGRPAGKIGSSAREPPAAGLDPTPSPMIRGVVLHTNSRRTTMMLEQHRGTARRVAECGHPQGSSLDRGRTQEGARGTRRSARRGRTRAARNQPRGRGASFIGGAASAVLGRPAGSTGRPAVAPAQLPTSSRTITPPQLASQQPVGRCDRLIFIVIEVETSPRGAADASPVAHDGGPSEQRGLDRHPVISCHIARRVDTTEQSRDNVLFEHPILSPVPIRYVQRHL